MDRTRPGPVGEERIVVMGVSGCGKSTVAAALAAKLGLTYLDGDTLHPEANITKMAEGHPLTDDDRWPWLEEVGIALRNPGTIIACSSLRRPYRELIRTTAQAPVTFCYLRGRRETLLDRMQTRGRHFMPPALLDSQLATLEEPETDEPHIVADIEDPVSDIVENVARALSLADAPTDHSA